jgi:hypothetical protein
MILNIITHWDAISGCKGKSFKCEVVLTSFEGYFGFGFTAVFAASPRSITWKEAIFCYVLVTFS